MSMPRRPNGQQITHLGKAAAENTPPMATSRQDFTYKKFAGLDLRDTNFRQSLFIGAIFQRCQFTAVSFDRCDFSGVKFIDCAFDRCSFVPDEIRSCILNRCTFRDCSFRGSQWLRIQTEKTMFTRCDFREASIRECEFYFCCFSDCQLKRSSLTLSDFRESRFQVVNLGDCTALFLFFEKCDFHDCHINAESIGFSYGLTADNLDSLKLIYLGRKQRKPKDTDIISSLISSYWDRKWYVGACVLDLNFDHSTPIISIRRVARNLYTAAKGGVISDWDELRFFIRVLRQLHAEQRLPLLGLWLLITTLHKIADFSKLEMHVANVSPAAEPVLADANKLLLTILDEIAPVLSLAGSSVEVRLDLELSLRPQTPLSDLIPKKAYETFGRKDVAFIEGRDGSWFETWQMSLGALAATQVSLVAINGVMAQLVKAVTQAKRLKKELTPKPSKAQAARKASSARTTRQVVLQSQILLPIIVQADLDSSRLRSESLSIESLKRLDVTLTELNKLKERELEDFKAYSVKRVEKVRVRKALLSRAPKRGRRERQISA
jgi:uncharacterized protein YjbI with pentapeptide repeats